MNTFCWIACAMVLSAVTAGARAADGDAPGKALYHVVSFKFKESATPEQIKKIADEFRALKSKIPEVVTYAGNTNVSKAAKDKGFNYCSVLTFKSQKDLDTYVASAPHQDFVKLIKDSVEDAFVIDFWE